MYPNRRPACPRQKCQANLDRPKLERVSGLYRTLDPALSRACNASSALDRPETGNMVPGDSLPLKQPVWSIRRPRRGTFDPILFRHGGRRHPMSISWLHVGRFGFGVSTGTTRCSSNNGAPEERSSAARAMLLNLEVH